MPSSLDLLRSSNSFENIVMSIPLALVILEDRQVILANQCAERLFGYSSEDILGRRVDSLVSSIRDTGGDPLIEPLKGHAHALCKNGTRFPVDFTLSALRNTAGRFTLASFSDISAKQRADVADQRMTAIIESAEDAILTKDLDGQIQSWNRGAERLLGYRAEDIVGASVTRLIPPFLQDEETLILNQIRKGQRVEHFETIRRKRDGSDIHVSLTISPIRDRSGTIVGASKIMRDISRRKAAEETLRRSNEELERINKELDEFVYTASHDLRSPLTNVGAVTQWILDDDNSLNPKSRDRLLLIQRRIERMKQLLNDIRTYARGGTPEDIGGPSLGASTLAGEVIDSLTLPVGFAVTMAGALERVQVTRNPLAQVLHNLINNAIKHHDELRGTVHVSVDAHGPMLKFSVIDDGPGIPKEYQEEIFAMFKTLKPRDQVEGSGMGLALVKKIVSRMGGVCGVQSSGARGSEFWFTWPKITPSAKEPL